MPDLSTGEVIALVSALISSLVSIFAVGVSWYLYRGSVRHASKPVLVFGMVSQRRWRLMNVGSGPAINVVVADFRRERQADSITKCYPIAAGGHIDLTWLRAGYELAVEYTDIFGAKYWTSCSENDNNLSARRGELIPDTHQTLEELDGRPEGGLRPADLHGKSAIELDLMRNEVYARHGYIFGRPDLQEYFGGQPWYRPASPNQRDIEAGFSPAERYTTLLILHYQQSFGLIVDADREPMLGESPPPPTLSIAPLGPG